MIVEARKVWLKDGETLTLRSPLAADAAALLEQLKTVVRESYRNMNQAPGSWDDFPVEKESRILQAFAESPSRYMISAFTNDGTIVGNLGAFEVSTNDFLKHSLKIGMGVVEKYQGRGLGNQLLRTAIFIAKEAGVHRLELSVRTHNKAGIALYESCGFRRIGLAKDVAFIDNAYVDEYLYDLILDKPKS